VKVEIETDGKVLAAWNPVAAGEVRTMELAVKLSEVELALRAQELATAERKMGDAERERDEQAEAWKETKKGLENEISTCRDDVRRLARTVRDRAEFREVPILEIPDYEAGAVNTYRTDTDEIVATRGMTPEERQRSLFEQQKAKREKAKGAEAQA
jgi:hypothetical protein